VALSSFKIPNGVGNFDLVGPADPTLDYKGFRHVAKARSRPLQLSSSRASLFTFSPEVPAALGPPSRLNAEVRQTFPALFDCSITSQLKYCDDNLFGLGVIMRYPLTFVIPANTQVGL
jgi:hypothetical protein